MFFRSFFYPTYLKVFWKPSNNDKEDSLTQKTIPGQRHLNMGTLHPTYFILFMFYDPSARQ